MTRSSVVLEDILIQSSQLLHQKRAVLHVFDLDSTLFNVHPRIEKILHDFAADPALLNLDPAHRELLKQVKADRRDWGIRPAVERAGIPLANPELALQARRFWMQNFFSNEYLKYDVPLAGSQDFVQFLHRMKAEIIYLTGRDYQKMARGSIEVLRQHGFPLDESASGLVMKPDSGIEDFLFKETWFKDLVHGRFAKIWFYENEPINLDRVRRLLPETELVFVDSTHSGRMPVPTDIPTIDDFQIEWDRVKTGLQPEHQRLLA